MRRSCAAVLIASALLALGALLAAGAAAQVRPRVSLPNIENDVMCVVCQEPLDEAQSPQADAERQFISGLIAKGDTKGQIERALVAQYGTSVLALPPAHGFNLTVYILPPAILLIGIAGLVYVIPRWKRRTRAEAAARAGGPPPTLDPGDAARLEEDLARHGP